MGKEEKKYHLWGENYGMGENEHEDMQSCKGEHSMEDVQEVLLKPLLS